MTVENLKTPTVALGTWAWGDSGETGDGYFGSQLTQAGLEEVADKAHAAGFILWDIALVYGMGRSETVLGEVLKRYARSDYQLSTKFTPRAAGTSVACGATISVRARDNQGERRCRGATIMPSWMVVDKED